METFTLPRGHEPIRLGPSYEEIQKSRGGKNKGTPDVTGFYIGLETIRDPSEPGNIVGLVTTDGTDHKSSIITDFASIVESLSMYSQADGYTLVTENSVTLDAIARKAFESTPIERWNSSLNNLIDKEYIQVGQYQIQFVPNKLNTSTGTSLKIKGFSGNRIITIASMRQWSPEKLCKELGIPPRLGSALGHAKTTQELAYAVGNSNSVQSAYKGYPSNIYNLSSVYNTVTKSNKKLDQFTSDLTDEVGGVRWFAYNCTQHAHWKQIIKHGAFAEVLDIDGAQYYYWAVSQVYAPRDLNWHYVKSHNEFLKYKDKAKMGFLSANITVFHTKISPIQRLGSYKPTTPEGSWLGWITVQEINWLTSRRKGEVKVLKGWVGVPKFPGILPPLIEDARRIFYLREQARGLDPVTNHLLKQGPPREVGKTLQKSERSDGTWTSGSHLMPEIYATALAIAKMRLMDEVDELDPESVILIATDGLLLDATKLDPSKIKSLKEAQAVLGGFRLDKDRKGQAIVGNADLYQIQSEKGIIKVGNRSIDLFAYCEENPLKSTVFTQVEEQIPLIYLRDNYHPESLRKVGSSITQDKKYPLEYVNYARILIEKIPNLKALATRQFDTELPLALFSELFGESVICNPHKRKSDDHKPSKTEKTLFWKPEEEIEFKGGWDDDSID